MYSTTDVMVRFSPILYRLTPRYLLYIRVNRVESGTGIKSMDLDSSIFFFRANRGCMQEETKIGKKHVQPLCRARRLWSCGR